MDGEGAGTGVGGCIRGEAPGGRWVLIKADPCARLVRARDAGGWGGGGGGAGDTPSQPAKSKSRVNDALMSTPRALMQHHGN